MNTYDEALSRYAEVGFLMNYVSIISLLTESQERFARDQIDVLTNARVKKVEADKILFSQKDEESGKIITKELPYGLCLWSTGVGGFPPQLHEGN